MLSRFPFLAPTRRPPRIRSLNAANSKEEKIFSPVCRQSVAGKALRLQPSNKNSLFAFRSAKHTAWIEFPRCPTRASTPVLFLRRRKRTESIVRSAPRKNRPDRDSSSLLAPYRSLPFFKACLQRRSILTWPSTSQYKQRLHLEVASSKQQAASSNTTAALESKL